MSADWRCLEWLASLPADRQASKEAALLTSNSNERQPSPHQSVYPQHPVSPGDERELSPHDSANPTSNCQYLACSRPAPLKRKRTQSDTGHHRAAMDTGQDAAATDMPQPQGSAAMAQVQLSALHSSRDGQPGDVHHDNDPTPTKPKRRRKLGMSSEGGTSSTPHEDDASSRSILSPVKQMNRLFTLDTPIVEELLDQTAILCLPPDIRTLFDELDRCQLGQSTVPIQFRATLQNNYQPRRFWQDEQIWKCDAASTPTPSLGELEALAGEAAELNMYSELEASWNSQCHGPLLILARRLSPHRSRIRIANITSARPHRRLMPSSSSSGKMVDFGILLKLQSQDDALQRALDLHRPEDDGVFYCNHTSSQQIVRNPLAISIETKRANGDSTMAKLQLRIWAATQMQWFAEIRRMTLPLPEAAAKVFLPLLIVIGSEWKWFLARGEFDRQTGQLRRTVVFDQQSLGDVKTLKGLFAVLEALLVLIAWMEECWRPWLGDWIAVDS